MPSLSLNIARASTISARVFIKEHEALSKLIQIVTLSLWHLEKTTSSGTNPSLNNLLSSYTPYWGHPPIANFDVVKRDDFIGELSRLGIMRVTSAFDHYINSLTAELDSASFVYKNTSIGQAKEENEDDKPPGIITFSKRIGLEIDSEQAMLLEFINVIRNCCAHRAGRASRKLIRLLGEDSIAKHLKLNSKPTSHKQWVESFPDLQVGDIIIISPVYAIWASGIYLNMAKEINSHVIAKLGLRGALSIAIHNLPKVFESGENRPVYSTQAAVQFVLTQMFIPSPDEASLIRILKKENLWNKAVEKFNQITLFP